MAFNSRPARSRLAVATVAALALFSTVAQAQVLSDRYRGYGFYWNGGGSNTRILEDLTLPHFQNQSQLVASPTGGVLPTPWATNNPITSLRALVETPSSYVTGASGTDTQLSWPTNGAVLCNPQANTQTGTAEPCASRIMGQASYTVLYFPQAGSYTLHASHDDEIEIAFTPEVGASDYREKTYTPQAELLFNCGPFATPASGSHCVSDTGLPIDRKEPLVTINVAENDTCQPIRVLWNNWGSSSSLELFWSGPGIVGNQLIPAANLLDPSKPYGQYCPRSVIPPAAVPTLEQGGLLMLSAMAAGLVAWRRRKKAAP